MAMHISLNKELIKHFLSPDKRKIFIWFSFSLIYAFSVLVEWHVRFPENLFQALPGIDVIRNWWHWQTLPPQSYLLHFAHNIYAFSLLVFLIILGVPVALLDWFESTTLFNSLLLVLTFIKYYLLSCLSIYLWTTFNKRGRLLVIISFLVVVVSLIIAAYFSYIKDQEKSYHFDSVGVLRSSGLRQDEKNKLGLLSSDFQLSDFPIEDPKNSEIHGYYLEGDSSRYKNLIGTCVQVRGRIKKGWRRKELLQQKYVINNQYTYNRSVLIPDTLAKSENCDPYTFSGRKKETLNFKMTSFEGILARTTRPAPDIAYDYELRLLEPVDNPFDASGLRQKRDRVIIVPSENSVWIEMEKSIDQVMTVNGYEKWGYAETSYLYATNIWSTVPERSEPPIAVPGSE